MQYHLTFRVILRNRKLETGVLQPLFSFFRKKAYIVSSALSIFHNCSKATENRQAFRDVSAVEILVPFLGAEKSETVVTALLTLSYITDDSQKDFLETDTKVRYYL